MPTHSKGEATHTKHTLTSSETQKQFRQLMSTAIRDALIKLSPEDSCIKMKGEH